MLLTCRSTVRSLIVSASAIARLVSPAATRRRTSASRALRPAGRAAGRAGPVASSRGEVRRRAEPLEHLAGGVGLDRRRRPGRRAPGRPRAVRTRTRAASYGASSSRHASHARRRRAAHRRRRPPRAGPRHRPGRPSPAGAAHRAASASSPVDRPRRGPRRRRRRRARSRRPARAASPGPGRRSPRPCARRIAPSRPRDVALREPEQRVAGLRAGGPTCRPRGSRPRRRRSAAQPVELGQLVDRLADARLGRRPRQPLAGALRLVGRLAPGAVEAHELGPVDEAVAAERDEVGLRVAPARQGRRSTPAPGGGRTLAGRPR